MRFRAPWQWNGGPAVLQSRAKVYAVSAYILNLNGIVGSNDVIDARSLPKVRMPNRDGFIPFPRNPK